MTLSRRQKMLRYVVGLGIALAVLSIIGVILLAIRGGGKPPEKPKFVPFVHMIKAEITTIGQHAQEGTIFILPSGKNFCSPTTGPRDEPILIQDNNLEDNTFMIVHKTSAKIYTLGQDFQDSYDYVEIHYKATHVESQVHPYPIVNCTNE